MGVFGSGAVVWPAPTFLTPKHKYLKSSTSLRAASGNEQVAEEDDRPSYSGSLPSARSRLDLLEQLRSPESSVAGDASYTGLTIRDQLAQLVGDRDDDFSIPLGKNLKKVSPKFLTVAQKRNIKRQAYLNEVSKRNDSVFFATIGAFVIFPPIIILGIAIANAILDWPENIMCQQSGICDDSASKLWFYYHKSNSLHTKPTMVCNAVGLNRPTWICYLIYYRSIIAPCLVRSVVYVTLYNVKYRSNEKQGRNEWVY